MEYDEFLVMMNDITQKIPEELNNNRELVIDVVRKNGLTLQYASDDIKTMQSLAVGQEVQEYYDHDAQIPKVKRFSYAKIKELYTEAQAIRSELHKTQSEEILNRLDAFIDEIHKISKSSSAYLNSDEVQSDLEWIIEYYEKKEWLNVTRWLSNIDGSLRDMWSDYMEKLKKAHGENPSASANFQLNKQ